MNLTFIGRGSAFNPQEGNNNAYFIEDSSLYLIDCGDTTFSRLEKHLPLQDFKEVQVILTHLHSDHVGSLGTLISYMYYLYGVTVTVIHPNATIVDLLTLLGIRPELYDWSDARQGKFGSYAYEMLEVPHAKDMKSYGILFTKGASQTFFSGDAADIPDQILDLFLHGKIQRLYQDVTLSKDNHNHLYLGKLAELIPRDLRQQVYCMHLDVGALAQIRDDNFNYVKEEEPCLLSN